MSTQIDTSKWPWNFYEEIWGGPVNETDFAPDHCETFEKLLDQDIPEREALAIRARYKEGLTYSKIGELLGVHPTSVYGFISRGLRKMRHPRRVRILAERKYGSIEYLEFPTRIYNALRRAGIERIGQLIVCSKRDLLQIRGIGENQIKDIEEILTKRGLQLSSIDTSFRHITNPNIPVEKRDIDTLDLSSRVLHILVGVGILTVEDLLGWTRKDLLNIRMMGEVGVKEIEDVLASYSLSLRKEVPKRRIGPNDWPLNLYEDIFETSVAEENFAPDHGEALEYIFKEYMSAKDAELLKLRYQEGLMYKDIKERMGQSSIMAISGNVTRCVEKMRKPLFQRFILDGMDAVHRHREGKQAAEHVKRSKPVRTLELPNFVCTRLEKKGIHTVGQLADYSASELLQAKVVGQYRLAEIQRALGNQGLALREEHGNT